MPAKTPQENESAFIDLHGLSTEEADVELALFLNSLPKTVRVVEVAHGYSHGTALKQLVKHSFYHWRIKEKRVGLNPGATYLHLK